ncbi:hypothetical protein H0H87_007866 [Tephrocybe sp. NHM501043]|nr:hypothetical protein H0H87_007866 [Tephrocybe sp. NHM501043]
MSFKDSVEAALDAYLGSTNYLISMSAIEGLNFPVSSKKKPSLWSFSTTQGPTVEPEAMAQSRHLHDTLVRIVFENRMTPLREEEILL